MRKNIRIKPSKSQSVLGLIVGIIFVFIGIFMVIPWSGVFGVFWTILALVATISNGINVFTDNGIATEVIEVSSEEELRLDKVSNKSGVEYNFDEKLRKLKALRDEGVLNEIEYQRKRQEILEKRW